MSPCYHLKLSNYLFEIAVAVDVLFLMTILQLVVLDIQPESLHDASPSLCMHTQETSKSWVQLVLRGLKRESVGEGNQVKSSVNRAS